MLLWYALMLSLEVQLTTVMASLQGLLARFQPKAGSGFLGIDLSGIFGKK